MGIENWISVNEAATVLGCTDGRIRQLLRDHELSGQKVNARAWIISRESVERLAKKPQTVGRPRVNGN